MKNKYGDIQNTIYNLDSTDWRDKAFSKPEATIRIGTTFSGIGAIEYAFKRLGLKTKILFAGDIDEECKKAYFANYDINENSWHKDIHDFDATPYNGQIDLFVGGAPCQAFSMRGKRGGFEDTRGTLFREFARIVIECKPKVFIFENVRGILSHDRGRTWKTIKQTFEEDCGYQVYFQILNGKNYGVPQSRERLFCIGFREETDFSFPAPVELTKHMYDYLDSAVPMKYLLKEKGTFFVTRNINIEKSYTQINGQIALCQKRNQQFNWHGDFIFHPVATSDTDKIDPSCLYNTMYGENRSYVNEMLPQYVASIDDNGNIVRNPGVKDYDLNLGCYRKLTPRECLRLMGFGDDFKISVPDTATYRQAGNSIIVDVLIALLKELDITAYGE